MGSKFDPLLGQLRTTDAGLSSYGIGSAVTSGTNKSILYVNASGNLTQDNANLSYDSSGPSVSVWGGRFVFGAVSGNAGLTIGLDASPISISRKSTNLLLLNNVSNGVIIVGPVRIGSNITPTAKLHLDAGSTTANTAPIQLTSGPLETTARAGLYEYNGNHYLTNVGLLRMPVGGTLFDHYADAGNTHTDGSTFDDLYSDTTIANTLNGNGDKIIAEYSGIFAASATATRDIKVLFAGSTILDTSALTTTTAEAWNIRVVIIRESSTVVRCMAKIEASTSAGTGLFSDVTYTRLTGLTLSGTNILKIQAVAGGTGAAANDIVAKLGTVSFQPAA